MFLPYYYYYYLLGAGGWGSAQFGVLQISSCDFEKGLRIKKETTNYEGVA